jgi:hypothetical protein
MKFTGSKWIFSSKWDDNEKISVTLRLETKNYKSENEKKQILGSAGSGCTGCDYGSGST